jgi:hypothetical protein
MKSLLRKLEIILVVIGLAIFSFSEVWGETWEVLVSDHFGEISYRSDSVNYMPNNILRIWLNISYTEKGRQSFLERMKLMGEIPNSYNELRSTLTLFEIDCKNMRTKSIWVAYYDDKKKKIEPTLLGPDFESWKPIRDNSFLQKVVRTYCIKTK